LACGSQTIMESVRPQASRLPKAPVYGPVVSSPGNPRGSAASLNREASDVGSEWQPENDYCNVLPQECVISPKEKEEKRVKRKIDSWGVVSICIGGGFQIGGAGGAQGCFAVDHKGVGFTASLKGGAGPSVGASGLIGFSYANAPELEKLRGDSFQASVPAGEGLVAEGAVSGAPDGYVTYALSGGIGIEASPPAFPVAIVAGGEKTWAWRAVDSMTG
jgi:hypothetical protein